MKSEEKKSEKIQKNLFANLNLNSKSQNKEILTKNLN